MIYTEVHIYRCCNSPHFVRKSFTVSWDAEGRAVRTYEEVPLPRCMWCKARLSILLRIVDEERAKSRCAALCERAAPASPCQCSCQGTMHGTAYAN